MNELYGRSGTQNNAGLPVAVAGEGNRVSLKPQGNAGSTWLRWPWPRGGTGFATCHWNYYSFNGIIRDVSWNVEGTTEFAEWFGDLGDDEQVSVGRVVELLVEHGPSLPFPYSSGINASRHRHMRELRIQHDGRPYRVLYAFDPRRAAILLLGGDKSGQDRWYDVQVPKADSLYDEYLLELKRDGLI